MRIQPKIGISSTINNQQSPINNSAFTLIELLVVIGVIAMLVGILLPVMARARASRSRAVCAAQLQQIVVGMHSYLSDSNHTAFWRGPITDGTKEPFDIEVDGMDYWSYGGRETGNANLPDGNDIWNRFRPRPLNPYVKNVNLFCCPDDSGPWPDDANANNTSHFLFTGCDYEFNANGAPWDHDGTDVTAKEAQMGLAGMRSDKIRNPGQTVMFEDLALSRPCGCPDNLSNNPPWHDGLGNVALADGHVQIGVNLDQLQDTTNYTWSPK